MASPRDTSRQASRPQRGTESQGLRTPGDSAIAASEVDVSEVGSSQDTTREEALQRRNERLEKKVKARGEDLLKCQGENLSLRQELEDAKDEAEEAKEEIRQLKKRQPTEDSSYIAQLLAELTSLKEELGEVKSKSLGLAWSLKEQYDRANKDRHGRDARDDVSIEGFCQEMRRNNDAIADLQKINRRNNDAIEVLQETNDQLVHKFREGREEKRDEDASADEDLDEDVRQIFDDNLREGTPTQLHPWFGSLLDVPNTLQ